MTDIMTKEQRSFVMSRIRSRWTTPERKVHNILKGRKIKHKMHPDINGNPDVLIKNSNTVLFVDGYFWHGCRKCSHKIPSSNKKFWKEKIARNLKRDKRISKVLKNDGYQVIRLWEHDIKKNFDISLGKILHEMDFTH